MTAFDIAGIQDRAHAFGCLQLTRKPFDVHAMRATVNEALQSHGLAGSLAELSLVDVIQMLCICRKTTTLRLSEGESSGFVVIENGEIIHAIWNEQVGEQAFFQMMSVTAGLFNTAPSPVDVKRTITDGWQGLLLEGIRLQDEAARDPEGASAKAASERSAKRPTPPTVPAGAGAGGSGGPSLAGADVDTLIDLGFTALRAGDHQEALRCWEAGLKADPNNRVLDLNLRRLHAKLEQ